MIILKYDILFHLLSHVCFMYLNNQAFSECLWMCKPQVLTLSYALRSITEIHI